MTRPKHKNSDRRAPGAGTCNGAVFKSAKIKSQRRKYYDWRALKTNKSITARKENGHANNKKRQNYRSAAII